MDIKKEINDEFIEGYVIMLTNDLSYKTKPSKRDCFYKQFSIHVGYDKKERCHGINGRVKEQNLEVLKI